MNTTSKLFCFNVIFFCFLAVLFAVASCPSWSLFVLTSKNSRLSVHDILKARSVKLTSLTLLLGYINNDQLIDSATEKKQTVQTKKVTTAVV